MSRTLAFAATVVLLLTACCPRPQTCPDRPPVRVEVPVPVACPAPPPLPRPTCPDPGTSPASVVRAAAVCLETIGGYAAQEQEILNGYRPSPTGSTPATTPR